MEEAVTAEDGDETTATLCDVTGFAATRHAEWHEYALTRTGLGKCVDHNLLDFHISGSKGGAGLFGTDGGAQMDPGVDLGRG